MTSGNGLRPDQRDLPARLASFASATAVLAQSGLPGAVVLDGFSARAIGGVTAKFGNGGQIALGNEFGGIGGNASIWIYRARASVPF